MAAETNGMMIVAVQLVFLFPRHMGNKNHSISEKNTPSLRVAGRANLGCPCWQKATRCVEPNAGNSVGDNNSPVQSASLGFVDLYIYPSGSLLSLFLTSSTMTEYDFSPEAFEAYIHKQQKIATWVDNTKRQPPANPFTPATPAVHALQIRREDDDSRHRRKESRDYRDRHRDQGRDRDKAIDGTRQHTSSPTSAKLRSNRSASYTTVTVRPDHTRGRSLPAPLQLPPQNGYIPSGKPMSPTYAYYAYPPKPTSPRDSKHSSRTSSSTWLPGNPHYPQHAPHSAPVIPPPMRSQTTPPNYTHPMQQHAAYQGASGYSPVRSTPFLACPHCPNPEICSLKQNAPQFPHSYYQPKQPPLFKRLFMNWGSNKQHKSPRRKRSSSL
jgi:hypothetical protein